MVLIETIVPGKETIYSKDDEDLLRPFLIC